MEQPFQLDELEQKYHEAQRGIVRLQQRVESQAYELQEQAHQIQNLEESLERATAQLGQPPNIDQQLEYFKAELLQIVEQRTANHQDAALSTGQNLLRQQLENQTRALKELRRDIDRMQRHDDQIALARTEATRLNKDVRQFQADLDNLRKELDERVKPLNYIEEQRRITTRSLTELSAELPTLHKNIESNLTKVQLVEQKIPQFAKYEAALDSLREEIRRHREHMDFQVAERERQVKNWTEAAEDKTRQMRENEAMLEKYAAHYQVNKRALEALQNFQENLQREQHRFGELQRLAEERQRTELEKFHANQEQRWQKQTMELQPQLGDFQKTIEAIQQRLDEMVKFNQTLDEQMNIVLQIIEEDIQARATAVNTWQERFEDLANGQA